MTELTALQAALAAEQATIYGYGVAGAVLTGADRTYATTALAAHTVIRDQLTALISALGATPVAAQPAYRLPTPLNDTDEARALAAQLEQSGAGELWDLVAATRPAGHARALAISWLSDAAVRAAHWGAEPALPGQPA
ncbi:MAG TPA: ferritin-like domain-containing protein [Mycobacteriales bacterium]|jgi:hypothetical protein|nr:ferritin-like domain-containing protein [Mycobacteriales bacterium]